MSKLMADGYVGPDDVKCRPYVWLDNAEALIAAERERADKAERERDACLKAIELAITEPQHVGLIKGRVGDLLRELLSKGGDNEADHPTTEEQR